MTTEYTDEQRLERSIRDMGSELGPVFHELSNDLIWLHAKWIQYRQLFGHSEERVNILNEVGGHFFKIVQDALWDDAVLSISRLTDQPQSMGKDNLTFLLLPGMIKDTSLKYDIEELITKSIAASSFAKDWRNRRLAHNDLLLALKSGSKPLKGISRDNVNNALLSFNNILNRLSLHYWQSATFYDDFIASGGEGENVIYYLHAGIRAEEAKMQRLRQRKPLPGDFGNDTET